MTSQVFHLVMLALVGAFSFVCWYGYAYEPWERKTAIKLNVIAASWFLYLLWAGSPQIVEDTFVRSDLAVLAVVCAVGVKRFLLGIEFAFTRHWAASPILTALRAGTPIDAATTAGLLESRPMALTVPGLRCRLHRLRARHAQALRDKVNADALLAEAIIRRERAREEAEILRSRRAAGPDAWRAAAGVRFSRHR
jgi:hypothetical protein